MTVSKPRENSSVWMSGGYDHRDISFETALITERMSTLTEIQVEFSARLPRVDLSEMVGRNMTVHVEQASEESGNGRMFTGTCISAEVIDSDGGVERYLAEVRPWFWMLTLTRNNRVFQKMNVQQIIEEVISAHGFTLFTELKLTSQYEDREYCVQYRESDFDFLSRLMEEEGLFYYFDYSNAFERNETLVICDGTIGLGDLGGDNTIDYKPQGLRRGSVVPSMSSWGENEAVVRGKVSLADYEFKIPSVGQMAVSNDARGSHGHSEYEFYDFPGHYRQNQNLGTKFAEVRLAADTARHEKYEGTGTYRYMGAGHTFTLAGHSVSALNKEYLVVSATHVLVDEISFGDLGAKSKLRATIGEIRGEYSYVITAIDKAEQFRAPMITPWPQVPGVQTGVVVGPKGEEIHTDEHGRVKVHFRWDRVNGQNENASCWIRVATGWSGNNWGLNSVPRMGQEVLIQFEDGDPDRPIVTGMLYNADTMPPYVDAAQPTRTGIMTRSSPDGGANDYNAMVFEDKAGDEYMHVQAQKDYQMVVKDSAQITIGDDGKNVSPTDQSVDAGSLKQTVTKNVTELVKEGNKSETIDRGKLDLTVEGNMTEVVRSGDLKVDVKMGKIDISAAQTITLEAMQSITLKVGSSTIELTQTGITIDAPLMLTMKGGVQTTVEGGAMTTVKGGFVMIN
jgi:type VI secretion system secreted protein VgrG